MNNENIKNVDKFVCEPCGFVTSFKRDYSRHLQTKKHMKMMRYVYYSFRWDYIILMK